MARDARAQDIANRFVDDDKKVVNMIGVKAHEQVMLKVRVAEMTRTVAKQFGINLASGQHVAFFAKRARARSIEHRVREGVTACAGYPAVAC